MRVTHGMIHGINSLPRMMHTRRPNFAMPDISGMLNDMMMNTARFMTNAGSQAGQLHNTLTSLASVLNRQTAASGNTDVLRIRSFDGNSVPEMSVLIEQIAKTQRNEGTAMTTAATNMQRGTYRFEIELGGETHEISFTTNETLTNRAFQQRMADAINEADIGVTASVTTAGSQSTLNLETRTTGAGDNGKPRFTIRDLSGNAVAATGVASVAREGQNAIFSVDGGEQRTSASNDVDLGGGLHVTLVSASEEAVTISRGRNVWGAQLAVAQMVDQFNALLETARGNHTDRNTRMLIERLEGLVRVHQRALSSIGVSMSADGFLEVDIDKLRAAAESGAVTTVLVGDGRRSGSGFVNSLANIAKSVSSNPTRFVSPQANNLPGLNAALNAASGGNIFGNNLSLADFIGNNNPGNQLPSIFDSDFPSGSLGHLHNSMW